MCMCKLLPINKSVWLVSICAISACRTARDHMAPAPTPPPHPRPPGGGVTCWSLKCSDLDPRGNTNKVSSVMFNPGCTSAANPEAGCLLWDLLQKRRLHRPGWVNAAKGSTRVSGLIIAQREEVIFMTARPDGCCRWLMNYNCFAYMLFTIVDSI